MKPGPLTPEAPWTTRRRSLVNELFRVLVPVVIEHNEIGLAHSVARTRHSSIEFNRRMLNRRRRPSPIRIVTTQIPNFQHAFAVRFDLIEQLDLIR